MACVIRLSPGDCNCTNPVTCSPCNIPNKDLTFSWSGTPGGSCTLVWNGSTSPTTASWSASGVSFNGLTVSVSVACSGGTMSWQIGYGSPPSYCRPVNTAYTCSPFHFAGTTIGATGLGCPGIGSVSPSPLYLDE